MEATTYTAIIRWRGPDPAIELETTHPGFATPEEAALYANGIPPRTPIGLNLLPEGSAVFMLNDYTEAPCSPEQLTVWVLPSTDEDTSDVILASDNDFQPVHPGELYVRFSAHGDYVQSQYGVIDSDGDTLDVRIEWDDNNRLQVTVIDTPVPGSEEAWRKCDFGHLPEA
jgi:hypothetical protein